MNWKNNNRGRRFVGIVWSAVATLISFAVLFFAFRDFDLRRLFGVLLRADPAWLVVLAVSIPLEQLLRGWKWRQILYDVQPVGSFRLFGAVMAGYFANILMPFGISPLVRAWLVARLEGLAIATVLLTTAIERFVDGVVFALLVGILILFATLPVADGGMRTGLMVAGGGSLALFLGLFGLLFMVKKRVGATQTFIGRSIDRLEHAFGDRLAGLGESLAEGIIWPQSRFRGGGVIVASIVMKLISTTYFLWAGLAFGVLLTPFDYLFIMVLSGFSLIIFRFVRIPGGGLIGAAYALKMLGVADEQALTMVLVVNAFSMILIAVIGAVVIWKNGLTVLSLRRFINRQGR